MMEGYICVLTGGRGNLFVVVAGGSIVPRMLPVSFIIIIKLIIHFLYDCLMAGYSCRLTASSICDRIM